MKNKIINKKTTLGVNLNSKKPNKQFIEYLNKTSGIFKNRKDMKDPTAWVVNQRKPRYENIFN